MTVSKIAVVLREDLAAWQKLNVTAFLASGVAARFGELVGTDYQDADGIEYLPMFGHPVLVYAADAEGLRRAHQAALARGLAVGVYIEDMFATGNDVHNRASVRAVPTEKLPLVGIAVHGPRNAVDRALKGLSLHS